MSGLLTIDDTLTSKISYYHLMLLMVSLPFNMYYSHIILLSYALHTLIHLNRKDIKPIFKLRTLALLSVFIITVLSTIYTINTQAAFTDWGKQITILLFLLLFCLNPFDVKKYRDQLLLTFSLTCTLTILYLYFDALITIKHYSLPVSNLFSAAFTNHNFSEPIDIHATFFSMQVALALVYLLSCLFKKQAVYQKILYLFCSVVLSAGILQLGSKSVFVALIIAINIALPFFLLKGRARLTFIIASTSVLVVVLGAILNSSTLRERYVKELRQDLTLKRPGVTVDSRLARWHVSLDLISKKLIFGYGNGSEIGLLQDGFFKNKLYSSYLNKLNTHSQFLSFLLQSGIVGLLAYLLTLTFGFRMALRRKDLLFFTFMVLITMVSVSENLLDVDKGIIFYALFFSFFVFSNEAVTNVKPIEIDPNQEQEDARSTPRELALTI